MQKLKIARKITHFVVGGSVGFTVRQILKNNIQIDETAKRRRKKQAQAVVGGVVIGGLVADASDAWVDKKFDTIEEYWTKFQNWLQIPEEDQETLETEDTPEIKE